ncbi:hypothetical protein ACSBR1_015323 [Camellia fascicularis]
MAVIFGAALLYDETTASFEWAMAKAISKIMPERLDAKDCPIKETVTVVENDLKLVIAARYRDLCPRMVKLATRSSE